jgi:hypothetical protein
MLVPVAVKLETVEPEHKVCVAFPVGAGVVEVTVIVINFLQVTPFVVTSTQYGVVEVGLTLIDTVVAPVDHK